MRGGWQSCAYADDANVGGVACGGACRSGARRSPTRSGGATTGSRVEAFGAQPCVHAQAEVTLEPLGYILVVSVDARGHDRVAVQAADEDVRVALVRELVGDTVDDPAEVCRQGDGHGDLGDLLAAADRGVA